MKKAMDEMLALVEGADSVLSAAEALRRYLDNLLWLDEAETSYGPFLVYPNDEDGGEPVMVINWSEYSDDVPATVMIRRFADPIYLNNEEDTDVDNLHVTLSITQTLENQVRWFTDKSTDPEFAILSEDPEGFCKMALRLEKIASAAALAVAEACSVDLKLIKANL